MEYLREVAHLRARSNTFGAMLRIRNSLTMAVHDYFQRHHFIHIHTPIINSNDCEGTGETFLLNVRQKDQKTHDPIDDLSNSKASLAIPHGLSNSHFFGVDECYLTVSGQLEAEIFASALSKVYTFGPAFRAENSHTSRHLSEFWMVEPEMSFVNLQELMETAEASIKSCVEYVLTHSAPDLNFFNSRVDQTLMTRLHQNRKDHYIRMSYSEAVKILQEKSGLGINWGQDLSREHERWICDCYTQKPVFITHYPKTLKPFYMRLADSKQAGSDAETVECFDLLVPKIGELVGGSSREERYDALKLRMEEMGLDVERLNWYLELRKFGTTPHAGFGIGFERLLMYITGLENIRDVIPIPRYPRYCKF
ncbi:probable asparagine--tRNA ligase, mitochondrial [Schistocerca gregaria]|uniref:probable asparagine--tRNA ligase, mitochondrial n=1 Tax=Schistocerca gregaria TaxID=7010 RepID=UPI00211EC0C6|nr:probable asparagine--tRNA ligase, mitochondrial [Schistocerca gregaria]